MNPSISKSVETTTSLKKSKTAASSQFLSKWKVG
jgi:hypothetical protein